MKFPLLAGGFVLGSALTLTGASVHSRVNAASPEVDVPIAEPASSQEAGGSDEPGEVPGMETWMATLSPGPEHELLEGLVGSWETTMRMWMMPGGNPMESKGTAETELVMDGRFALSEFSGTMMGMPLETMNVLGYDRYKKKYIGVSLGTMGTNIQTMEGTLDQTGKVITLFGSMDEPMTGEHDKTVKYVHRFVDEDTRVFEVHDMAIIPGETRVIEIEYAREK